MVKLSAENKMLTLFTSSVTHEMITPLRCITQLATTINVKSIDSLSRKQSSIIFSTCQLLQSEIKLLLDRNLIEKKSFRLHVEDFKLNEAIKATLNILIGQAEL